MLQDLVPHRLDLFVLREESMPSHVEAESAVHLRPRQAADDSIFLNNHGAQPMLRELVSSRETGRPCSDHDKTTVD